MLTWVLGEVIITDCPGAIASTAPNTLTLAFCATPLLHPACRRHPARRRYADAGRAADALAEAGRAADALADAGRAADALADAGRIASHVDDIGRIAGRVDDAGRMTGRVNDVVDPLKQRVDDLHRLLDPYAQNHRTTAIVRGEKNGQQIDIVASSNQRLDPRQRAALRPGEIEASRPGHAEAKALEYAQRHGITPQKVAASRPICPACTQRIAESGAHPVSPLRRIRSGITEE